MSAIEEVTVKWGWFNEIGQFHPVTRGGEGLVPGAYLSAEQLCRHFVSYYGGRVVKRTVITTTTVTEWEDA